MDEKDISTEMEVIRTNENPFKTQKVTINHTQRCRRFVKNSKNILQEDSRYIFEKHLRDYQLSTVLRALLLMEAKLKREQKRLVEQLYKKDLIIQKQKEDIQTILYSQYCKKCSQLYNPGFHLENEDSSTYLHSFVNNDKIPSFLDENMSSNINSPSDSSYDEIVSIVESPVVQQAEGITNNRDGNVADDSTEFLPIKDKSDSSCDEQMQFVSFAEYRYHKIGQIRPLGRKLGVENSSSSGSSFQQCSNTVSSFSDEENTSDDYENLESLPTETISDQFSVKSLDTEKLCSQDSLEKCYNNHYNIDSSSLSFSESNITVIRNIPLRNNSTAVVENLNKSDAEESCPESKLPESSLVFDLEADSNEKWYVSASDNEDEQEKNIYKNNPVLECVNQILLQNIDTEDDSLNYSNTSINEVDSEKNKVVSETLPLNRRHNRNETNKKKIHTEYYETPIQETPNFYETPVSVYSNDYEQIRSKSSDSQSANSPQLSKKEVPIQQKFDFERKYKILRTPPSLPPKPVNLLSKYRIHNNSLKLINEKLSDRISLDSEPDYCSISELNLPTKRLLIPDKTQVIAEVHATDEAHDSSSKLNHYDFVEPHEIDKTIENPKDMEYQKQNYKHVKTTYDSPNSPLSNNIPKLPSVSEIIIPEEGDKKITQYNQSKNNQKLSKTTTTSTSRKPIKIGSSVSALIMGFNNKELLYEINKKTLKTIQQKELITMPSNSCVESEVNNEDCFIQNFEEFKLDDCELQEFTETNDALGSEIGESEIETNRKNIDNKLNSFKNTTELKTLAEEVADINLSSLNLNDFIGKLERCNNRNRQLIKDSMPSYNWKEEPSYEDFLECTGLSSKSILTSSQMTNTTNHTQK